ncbi:MAG: dipeptide epimerase [Bacteroidales bacterium]|jgi:L-alanine-DL-glutamate epimerase-like enolase superfamily enzyme|nr:dipeptide epimerase [Bacteroidales bacterium]MCU0410493.1 dipeptide epimerase [Bacteroidales bacterium]
MKKREFIKFGGLAAGALIAGCTASPAGEDKMKRSANKRGSSVLKLSFRPYELQLKHVFTVASSSRTTTPVVLTEIEYEGVIGYGEASMPPYLGESHKSVTEFLSKVNLEQFSDPFLIEDILDYVENIMPGNYAAKAAVDIALHDLTGKLVGQPWFRLWGLNPVKTPFTSFTIGIDTPDVVTEKTKEADVYSILKVKLGRDNDREMIETVRSVTGKPVYVDVNQGWKDKEKALEMIQWLSERNVIFVEQPMPKEQKDDIAWLTERSPVPILADEALQTLPELLGMRGLYTGINVKLMKCGGMNAAYKMMTMARQMGMKILIGCMTETSCAISAAAQLSPLADWADLDGNLLISNDLYEGATIVDGKVTLPDRPGIGITVRSS